MGQHILPNHDEGSIALRRLLEVELKEKKILEVKVSLPFSPSPHTFFPSQVKRLEEEIIDLGTLNATLADQLNEVQSENEDLMEQLAEFSSTAIDRLVTLKECDALESKVKVILHNIEQKKVPEVPPPPRSFC
jgi:predicted RNase H-like nuclease (RuvC/YqgF family)